MSTALVTGVRQRQHDVAAALERAGFVTLCPDPDAYDGLRAVPPASLGCYVQLPLPHYVRDEYPVGDLQGRSADLMARVQWVAVVAPLLEPGATVVLVPGHDGGANRWDGLDEIEFLAEMLRTHPVVSSSKIVVADGEQSPAQIARAAG